MRHRRESACGGSPKMRPSVVAVPLLAPDETAFSLLARTGSICGPQNSKALCGSLLGGDERAGLIFDFPQRLAALASYLPGRLSDPATLASQATVLPFYVRFRDSAVTSKAITKMCGPSVAALKDDLGLRASAAGTGAMVKACPECMAADISTIGVPYWHRALQLPGVTICPTHRIPLLESASVRQGKQCRFFLPHELHWTSPYGRRSGTRPDPNALRFAMLSTAALSAELPGGFNPETLHFTYRHGLKSAGFLSPRGWLRATALQHHLRAYVACLPDSVRLCRPELGRETDILIAILRSRTETFNTLPHLALIDFLFECWAHFVATYDWERSMGSSRAIDSAKLAPSTPICQCKVRAGSAIKHEQCTRAIELYLREHPAAFRTQVARACGGAWRWLYRHDRTWLDANAPPPIPRGRRYISWVDWEQRDTTLVGLIESKDRVESFPPSARATPKTVLKTLGRLQFSVQLDKMPNSMAKLVEIALQIRYQRKNSLHPYSSRRRRPSQADHERDFKGS